MIKKDKMSRLFEDAIADAKAVRDTAMINAKKALEEAFAPKLQAMFSEKIRQEAEEENMDDVEPVEAEPKEDDLDEAEDVDLDIDLDDESMKEENEPIEQTDDADIDEEVDIDFNFEEEPVNEADDVDIDFEDDEPVKEGEEDVDIDFEDDEPVKEGTDDDIEIEFDTDEEEEPVKESEEDVDIDFETDKDDEIKESKRRINSLTKKLQESIKVITTLRKSLNETNLLNARLSGATQIFTKFNTLTDKQKLQIIDKFDEADTIKEVKLVFSTLTESLKGKTKVPAQVRRITEGIASKSTGTTAPSRKVLTESSDAIVKRFQKLANIN